MEGEGGTPSRRASVVAGSRRNPGRSAVSPPISIRFPPAFSPNAPLSSVIARPAPAPPGFRIAGPFVPSALRFTAGPDAGPGPFAPGPRLLT